MIRSAEQKAFDIPGPPLPTAMMRCAPSSLSFSRKDILFLAAGEQAYNFGRVLYCMGSAGKPGYQNSHVSRHKYTCLLKAGRVEEALGQRKEEETYI